MQHATSMQHQGEYDLAGMLYDELSNQWAGRGLIHEAAGCSDDGRWVIAVSGAIDLVALARRALSYMAPDLDTVLHG
jgi:hypothetical protein